MLGSKVNLPCDVVFPRQYRGVLCTRQEKLKESCRKTKEKNHDPRAVEKKYVPGQLVYKINPVNKKLEVSWVGPLVVVEAIGQLLYKVADKKKRSVLHHDLLREYPSGGEVPQWANKLRKQIN